MSYILDALRRAEADRERERGQVPGLHTQPPPGSAAVQAAGRRRWLPWAGGGLLLLVGLGAGSWWAGGPPEAALPAPPTETAATPRPAPAPTPSMPMPQPATAGSPYLAPAPPPGTVATAPAPRPARAAVPEPAPSPAPMADTRVPRLSELPESTRRELPKLAISGSVYSDHPPSRFVIVNGEVVREGARLGADLVLEQIGPRELVLRFKGQRYRQPV